MLPQNHHFCMRRDLHSFIRRLKSLEIQGARQIAMQSVLFLKKYDPSFGRAFDSAALQIENARPTAVVLHNCLRILRKERNTAAADELVAKLHAATEQLASNGAKLIKNGDVLMTHCHSGEALSVVKAAKKQGKHVKVIATITEPLHQGLRTVKELKRAGIPVTLIADPATGFFMPHVDMVLTGSDAMRREGNVNKIGTQVLALTAAAHRKPYYIAADLFKLDNRKKFAIEERPAYEIWPSIKGVAVRNPAFDITPWSCIKSIITEEGVMKPKEIVGRLK